MDAGFATLFGHLLMNRVWLRRVLKLPFEKADRLFRTSAAAGVLTARRDAAALLHEIAYHRGAPEAEDLWLELVRRSSWVAPRVRGHVVEVTPEISCARSVRASMFEGLAHRELRERFDEDWFLNPRAGELLRSLFSRGGALDLHEICQETLGGDLDPAHVARRYEEVLG